MDQRDRDPRGRFFDHQNTGFAYATVTGALIVAVTMSWWCWSWQNASRLPVVALHEVCLAVWALSGILLAVSQLAFVVIAIRRKHNAVLLCAGGILFVVAVFVLLLSMMPS